jgi:Domain of unknown function (DU1801)
MKPFENQAVADVFASYPLAVRPKLMALREVVFRTAADTPGVGGIEETLKWGEPAYLTSQSKSGSTIRLGWKKSRPTEFAMFFNCQTNLVETFRLLFPQEFKFEGQRAIWFSAGEVLPRDAVAFCVRAALTYHARKKP